MRVLKLLAIALGVIFVSNVNYAEDFQVEQRHIFHLDNPNNKIEYYFIKPKVQEAKAILIFLHGHQEDKIKIGGLKRVEDGTLSRYAKMGYLAIAMSFPGYGNSDGTRDWCGPYSQRAVESLIKHLNKHDNIKNNQIYLIGNSRGAVVAGMVATRELNLAGVVLNASFYDLTKVTHERTLFNMKNEGVINSEAIDERSIEDKAASLTAPILMLHGYFDERAPVTEAFKFYDKLMSFKKDAILMVFPLAHKIPMEIKYEAIDMFIANGNKKNY